MSKADKRLPGCIAAAAAVLAAAPPPDALRAGLALFVLTGGLWMTQALHLSVTALLVPLPAAQAGIGCTQWLAFGLPPVLVLLPLMAALLHALLRPKLTGQIDLTADVPIEWNAPRRWTLAVLALTEGACCCCSAAAWRSAR